MSGSAVPIPVAGPGREAAELDQALAEVVADTGAHVAGLYVLAPSEQVLRLEVVTGIPSHIVGPWARVGLA
ncbi:hypothetical protein, partial [Streptomyces sp. NPDC055140]